MKRWKGSLVWLLLFGCLLSGCDRWAEVSSGLYIPRVPFRLAGATETGAPDPESADAGINAVFVDRKHKTVWITFDDESIDLLPYEAQPREAWPSGCPTNVNATRMEVLKLDVERLTLKRGEVGHPILVRNCPPDPQKLVLRDDGEIGGAGTACGGAEMCIILEWAASSLSLPSSMKGYTLYSWPAEDDSFWRYTLITGTNRDPTWDEISAPGNTLGEEGWVKITVNRERALKSLFDRLPEGEVVFWIGPEAGRATPDVGSRVELPALSRIEALEAYCAQRSVDLKVIR